MTIGIVANLSDGAVLGADSAITIQGRAELPQGQREGVLKVYTEAEKVSQLADLPVGVMAYGMAFMGKRTILSYIREFEGEQDGGKKLRGDTLKEVSDKLRKFLGKKYMEVFGPELEERYKTPYDKIPPDKKPLLGIVMAGYSPKDSLSEVWEARIPYHEAKEDLRQVREKGNFGTNWFGQFFAITRLHKGFDPNLISEVVEYFASKFSVELTPELKEEIQHILAKHEFKIPFDAMPLMEGINHVRFLLDVVINQYKYVIGAPVCGGNVRIAVVTKDGYKLVAPQSRPYD